jgi:hypothetical protein
MILRRTLRLADGHLINLLVIASFIISHKRVRSHLRVAVRYTTSRLPTKRGEH